MDKPHRKLQVWQLSMEFTFRVYELTKNFPTDEKFGLTSQLRRAAVSIPSNIAEGVARNSSAEFARYLTIAIGSLAELDTQLEISTQLNYCDQNTFSALDEQLSSISRMLIAPGKRSCREIQQASNSVTELTNSP